MPLLQRVLRFPWQSTINLSVETGARVEACGAINGWNLAGTLREVVKEGLNVLISRFDADEKKRYEGLIKTILEQKELRKVIAGDHKKGG